MFRIGKGAVFALGSCAREDWPTCRNSATPLCDDAYMGSGAAPGVDTDQLFAAAAAHARVDLGTLNRAALQGELSLFGHVAGWVAAHQARLARALSDRAEPGTSPEHDVA